MRRRDFIVLLGGAVAAWPLAARAQQSDRMRRLGILMGLSEGDAEGRARVLAVRQRLQDAGWTEGRNIQIDYRFAAADADRMQTLAQELVTVKPDLIVGQTTPVTAALQALDHEHRLKSLDA